MVAYSFQARFAERILDGTKAQTIRAPRKRHASAGEEMQLYVGVRTRSCRLVARTRCLFALPITIHVEEGGVEIPGEAHRTTRALDLFAQCDGFLHWQDMQDF